MPPAVNRPAIYMLKNRISLSKLEERIMSVWERAARRYREIEAYLARPEFE
jgi:hypothetical protein